MYLCSFVKINLLIKLLFFCPKALLSHERHVRILRTQFISHLAGGREAHEDGTDVFLAFKLFLRCSRL